MSEQGREEARALAERLSGVPFARIASSPIQRCLETLEPILRTRTTGVAARPEVEIEERLKAVLKEITDARQAKNSLVNKVFELCLDFLEQQASINQKEGFIAILDKLMLLKPCCSFELRQRIYRVFEKFNGSSLRAKLIYFFSKITQDDHEKVI